MFSKPAFFVWSLAAPVLTGMIITGVLLVPSLQAHLGMAILASAAVGFLAAVPLSIQVGKAIT